MAPQKQLHGWYSEIEDCETGYIRYRHSRTGDWVRVTHVASFFDTNASQFRGIPDIKYAGPIEPYNEGMGDVRVHRLPFHLTNPILPVYPPVNRDLPQNWFIDLPYALDEEPEC